MTWEIQQTHNEIVFVSPEGDQVPVHPDWLDEARYFIDGSSPVDHMVSQLLPLWRDPDKLANLRCTVAID